MKAFRRCAQHCKHWSKKCCACAARPLTAFCFARGNYVSLGFWILVARDVPYRTSGYVILYWSTGSSISYHLTGLC